MIAKRAGLVRLAMTKRRLYMGGANMSEQNLRRRDVLKGLSAVALGAAGSGSASGAQTPAGGGDEAVAAPAKQAVATAQGSRVLSQRSLDGDVVVVGGGMAGVCAAIAAARHGAKVVLVQNRHVLGGNASSEVRMHIVGADNSGSRRDTEARETGIIEELRLEDAVRNPQRSASSFDLLLYDWVKREPNITLLLDTACYGVEMAAPERIAAIFALRDGTEDVFTIRGRIFIDCSGDGRLGVEAGAEYRVGSEAAAEFGESLAPREANRHVMGSSLLFITRDYGAPMSFVPPPWIRKFASCEDLPKRGHNRWEYGYWWVEWGGELDTIKDNDRIRDELLAAALGVWDHIKNSGAHPESRTWALDWLGFLPGKRESRRFVGDHMLIEPEVRRGETFEDGVAFGGWPIDLHPPKGIYSPEAPSATTKVPLYNIPLRCLYSRNIANLMFAGRNASVSRVAFGSTRVMATCAVMGQAAGTAAAMCAARRLLPRQLGREAIGDLQQALLRDDAYIIGVSNSDASDLARSAEVRASSESPGAAASAVINGLRRGVGRTLNRWISGTGEKLPQWIELRWGTPQRVRELHLVLDSGLNRPLALTHSDAFNSRMVRGPQPETLRDYELQLVDGDSYRTIARVEGNYQRRRIHRFEPATAKGIRLLVPATNGAPAARVFEIRAYA